MQILNDIASLGRRRSAVVVAAGFFDGIHLGHRKVIDASIARARQLGGQAWVLSFDKHPMKVLNPRAAPPLLTSNRHKLRLLARMQLDGCLLLPFTRELANEEPVAFVDRLLGVTPPLAEITVGRNWRFGYRGHGSPALLARLSRDTGLRVTVVRPVVRKGETVSSTRLRAEVMRGSLEGAAAMLGRPFSILGTVTRGRAVGRQLGYPTANLDCHNEVLPPFGVYAVRADIEGKRFDAVLNLGLRPTFGSVSDKPTLELHVFDFRRQLYGKDIEVFFVSRLRPERRFRSPKELQTHIAADVESARTALSADGNRAHPAA